MSAAAKTQKLVNGVFDSVSTKYDIMNDVMSLGIHRYWKNYFVNKAIKPCSNTAILECAAGSGDISFRILDKWRKNACKNCKLVITDVNNSMLQNARDQYDRSEKIMLDENINVSFEIMNGEKIPDSYRNSFDSFICAFGMRNMPHLDVALKEAHKVLKNGGTFHCLEFSKVQNPLFKAVYDVYSSQIIPPTGHLITGSWDSYQYLVDSIRLFPEQPVFAHMLEKAGFFGVKYTNLTNGIVSIHSAIKIDE